MRITKTFSLLSSLLIVGCSSEEKLPQPNVLLIVIDDLGWNDLGCMGSEYYETPSIDGLANRGTIFTNGYAGCSVSSPSRGSLITGKSPARHGITSWIGDPEGEAWGKNHKDILLPAHYKHNLDRDEYSIASAFKDGGYATYFIGKWHLGDEVYPTDFGFDVNIGGWAAGAPRGGYFAPFQNPMLEDHEAGENLSLRLSTEAITLMQQERDEPFFMMLSYYAVHGAIQTTEEKWQHFRDKAEAQGIETEGFEAGRRLPVRKEQDNPIYGGLVNMMDDAVGMVLDYLSESGLDKNTIVIFTSDNGGVVSGDSYSTSLKPLRGGKGTQWEGGIRVPFIIYNPQMQGVVKRVDTPVTAMDLYPTLLDMASLEPQLEQHRDGVTIKSLMEGKEIAPRALYWHYPHYGNQGGEPSSIIREGDWKLIYYYEDRHVELYNLSEDLSECHDLASQHPDMVTSLHNKLDIYLQNLSARTPQLDRSTTEEERAEWRKQRYAKTKAQQERVRTAQLQESWRPNKDWWGSQPLD